MGSEAALAELPEAEKESSALVLVATETTGRYRVAKNRSGPFGLSEVAGWDDLAHDVVAELAREQRRTTCHVVVRCDSRGESPVAVFEDLEEAGRDAFRRAEQTGASHVVRDVQLARSKQPTRRVFPV